MATGHSQIIYLAKILGCPKTMVKEELLSACDPSGVSQAVAAVSLVAKVADHASSDKEEKKNK